jgi:hypothetical protein
MMPSWFRNKAAKPKLTIPEGLTELAQHGIAKRGDVTLDDILFSQGGSLEDHVDHIDLLCILGSESEQRHGQFLSDDIWHFDAECIVEDGDYVNIANHLQRLSKGVLELSTLIDHVDLESDEAWMEFDFQGKRIHWNLKVDNDWVDADVFTRFVNLFASVPSEARFTYGDLGGQDCLIGFATEEQRRSLIALTGIKFEWLR